MNWLHMEWIYILVAGFCLVFYWCMHLSSSNSKILVCRLIWLERILSPHPRLPMWFFCWTMFHSNQHQKSCYHFFFCTLCLLWIQFVTERDLVCFLFLRLLYLPISSAHMFLWAQATNGHQWQLFLASFFKQWVN